ncbi:hypothetical protein MBANPS3_006413 [Mucor bainieri]
MSIKLNLQDTIAFERPLTRVVKQSLTIENPHDQPVAFKVKTTAPKLYCVRPNSDIIRPKGSIEVQIMLQAQREEPPLDVKCRDKFLILSTFVDEVTEQMSITELWNYVEGNDKHKKNIHQHKLRCVYTPSKEAKASTVPAPAAPAPVAQDVKHLNAHVLTAPAASAAAPADNDTGASADAHKSQDDQAEVIEKLKAMERELSHYKEAEKLKLKSGFPTSIYILIALMIAAIAYFISSK